MWNDLTKGARKIPVEKLAKFSLFSQVVTNRISDRSASSQPKEQAGSWGGFSTMDQIQTVSQVVVKTEDYKKKHLCADRW